MALQVAIQMDHISTIDFLGDSSFLLAMEAQTSGYDVFHYLPEDLYYKHGRVHARAQTLHLKNVQNDYFSLGPTIEKELSEFEVILMRQDPPFDMSYIAATHLLELVKEGTLVINNPREVRNAPEKLFMLRYPELLPPTLITKSINLIKEINFSRIY